MILLIDNYDSFTYNLAHLFGELGAEVVVRRNDSIDPDEAQRLAPSHLVVSPGPGRPEDAGATVEIVRRLAGSVPTLGVCLGHQAIVEAFGGQIGPAKRLVHGKASPVRHDGLGIFDGLPEEFDAGRYHSLAATAIPDELEVSATCAEDEVMAVRHRELRVDGVQFHPESVLTPIGSEIARNFLRSSRSSGAAGKGGKPATRRTVQTSTDKRRGRSIVPPAASGSGGAGLRPAGADADEGREG
ncbi:MAG: aminodeoxychorismate/anthranilate synthase component II [Gaiellaceae bacterium]